MEQQKIDLSKINLTPLMQQYVEIKNQFLDSLIFYQVGDFYELFFDDAVTASRELAITLTAKNNTGEQNIPLCGVPCHAADYYIIKLARAGFKVVVCDQLEDSQQGKIVKRGVTRVITPGTMTESTLLAEKKASYLMILTADGSQNCSLLVAELMTGMLWATTVPLHHNLKYLEAELVRFTPDEIVIAEDALSGRLLNACKLAGYMATLVRKSGFDGPEYNPADFNSWQNKFANGPVVQALQTFYRYMLKYQPQSLNQFNELAIYDPQDYLYLDAVTQKTLEITEGLHGDKLSTLFTALDETVTPMGARTLRHCLAHPLKNLADIQARQQSVSYFVQNVLLRQQLRLLLKNLPDVQRVVGRCLLQKGSYNDYQALKDSLGITQEILPLLTNLPENLQQVVGMIGNFEPLYKFLNLAINDNKIGAGFDLELDHLRAQAEHATQKLLEFEQHERLKTGISSLKIIYNQVHGYLIEITNTNLGAVPSYYEPYQKLSGRERFTVPELRALEQTISRAKKVTENFEKEVFAKIVVAVTEHARGLRLLAQSLAWLDFYLALAHLAATRQYCCPEISTAGDFEIVDGRHPVIERLVHRFVPNSLVFKDYSTYIITGPNMGGKSTYLRQYALIIILAQVGSYVPAAKAKIVICDLICTRIGTGDNLKEGKSTFLIEMEETAAICHAATANSFVILDEVGRGTSTQDGVAIAQAVVEFLHQKGCKLLFATHYHELTQMTRLGRVGNLHVVVERDGERIIFMHNLIAGPAESSFGVEVAKIAGMPQALIARAYEILSSK